MSAISIIKKDSSERTEAVRFFLAAIAIVGFIITYVAYRRTRSPKRSDEELPSSEKRWGDGTRDVVEEASWESFPASDSPAW